MCVRFVTRLVLFSASFISWAVSVGSFYLCDGNFQGLGEGARNFKMAVFGLFAVFGCLIIHVLSEKQPESDVMKFTDANFKEGIKPFDVLLVKFYAPW